MENNGCPNPLTKKKRELTKSERRALFAKRTAALAAMLALQFLFQNCSRVSYPTVQTSKLTSH